MILNELAEAVKKGSAKKVKLLTNQALEEGCSVEEIPNVGLIEPMGVVGERFKRNEIFVPEMLVAARAMSAGVSILEPLMVGAGVKPIGKVVIGTVSGDLHDIGKNLVAMMMKGIGAIVYDLGVDVPAETFLEKAEEVGADIVSMSALQTTTMTSMQDVIRLFETRGMRDKYHFMVGGAPVSQQFADEIGADAYTSNAGEAAAIARAYLEARVR